MEFFKMDAYRIPMNFFSFAIITIIWSERKTVARAYLSNKNFISLIKQSTIIHDNGEIIRKQLMIGNEQLAKILIKMIITIGHNNVLIMRDFESSRLRQIEDKIIETTEPIKYPHTAPPLPNNGIIKGIVIISIKNENIQNRKNFFIICLERILL